MVALATSYVSNAFDYLYGTPEAAVAAFIAKADGDRLTSAAEGIAALFDECADEEARDRVLEELSWGYAPDPGELDEFLRWTQAQLRKHRASAAAS
ncbi:MAG: hypothetical protein ABR614_12600 [Mycobacteriales bacterium]